MTTIKDIIISQKQKLETSLSYYQELIDNFDRCDQVYNQEILQSIEDSDTYIDKINENFEKIQYNFDLTIMDKNLTELKRIQNYQNEQKIIKLFAPYMIYMRLMLGKNE